MILCTDLGRSLSRKSIVVSLLKHSSVVRLINWRSVAAGGSRGPGVLRVDLIEFSKEAVTREADYLQNTIGSERLAFYDLVLDTFQVRLDTHLWLYDNIKMAHLFSVRCFIV